MNFIIIIYNKIIRLHKDHKSYTMKCFRELFGNAFGQTGRTWWWHPYPEFNLPWSTYAHTSELAQGWRRVSGFPCNLQFRNSRGACLETRVCDSMGEWWTSRWNEVLLVFLFAFPTSQPVWPPLTFLSFLRSHAVSAGFLGLHSRAFSATGTPNSLNHSYDHCSLSEFTREWFTNRSNHIHTFTPITRIVATMFTTQKRFFPNCLGCTICCRDGLCSLFSAVAASWWCLQQLCWLRCHAGNNEHKTRHPHKCASQTKHVQGAPQGGRQEELDNFSVLVTFWSLFSDTSVTFFVASFARLFLPDSFCGRVEFLQTQRPRILCVSVTWSSWWILHF